VKLRIKGDSLRLRLSQGEVSRLRDYGLVEDRTRFGAGNALVYRLRVSADVREIAASFDGGALEVRLPEQAARRFCATEEVTLAAEESLPDGALRILVEKDFACLQPRDGEDESDNFPHPATGAKSC
jgi:hypothetical protein